MKIVIKGETTKIEAKEYIHISGVTEFVIPKSVEKIGDSAFSVYTDMKPTLQRFTVDKENPCFDEIDGVLVSKDRKRLIAFPIGRQGSYTIPDGIEVIEKSAFRMGKFLDEVIIPDSVKKIEKGAFYYCSSLKNVHIGCGAEVIGEQAFYYCTSLRTVTGGEGITRIRKKAFVKCAELESFVFGNNVKEIDEEAFYGCDKAAYTLCLINKCRGRR
ncbi:MAG: leucine-rich repeat domain-containing protein, partial [Lachnospiraceae bacterium]|nr:leucine-rich repeat domain-containing protein [Lachnospiraceae bacterium]